MRPLLVLGATGLVGRAALAEARRHGAAVGAARRGADVAVDLGRADDVTRLLDRIRPAAVIDASRPYGAPDAAVPLAAERVLLACASRGVRCVAVGSAAEYGPPESDAPLGEGAAERPSTPYGRAKLRATRRVRRLAAAGADVTCARLFNVADPAVPLAQPFGEFRAAVLALADGGEVVIRNAATVRDVVTSAFAAQALVALARGGGPPVVNVCAGRGVSFGELVEALAARRGVRARVRSLDEPGIDAVVGDPTRLRLVTGLRARDDVAALAAALLGP